MSQQLEGRGRCIQCGRPAPEGILAFGWMCFGCDTERHPQLQSEARYIGGDRKRGPLAYADRVVAGMTRERLYRELFTGLARDGVVSVAEIGVADGRNALAMCERIPGLRLRGVDPWATYQGNSRGGPQAQHEGNREKARARLAPYAPAVTLVRAASMDAVREVAIGSLDAVYVDGNHSFDWVMTDLIEWSRRVRRGGLVAAHDFYEFANAGVVEAVVAYTRAHGITDWHLCDEREPSVWWVKP